MLKTLPLPVPLIRKHRAQPTLGKPSEVSRILSEAELDAGTQSRLQEQYALFGSRSALIDYVDAHIKRNMRSPTTTVSLRLLDYFLVHFVGKPEQRNRFFVATTATESAQLYMLYSASVAQQGKTHFDTFARGTKFYVVAEDCLDKRIIMTYGQVAMMSFCRRYSVFDALRNVQDEVEVAMEADRRQRDEQRSVTKTARCPRRVTPHPPGMVIDRRILMQRCMV
jgi:hypothetical protein